MAAQRRARRRRKKRARGRGRAVPSGGGLLLGLLALAVFWSRIWVYVVVLAALAAAGALGWWLWRTDRLVRGRDRAWRRQDAVAAGHRTLAEVDGMTGTEFEDLVAALCRRDGCGGVRRVGGSGDQGADVVGRLPDGRSMVVQCKRYAPSAVVASREVRDLLGSKVHFGADVAVFVTTTRFSGQAMDVVLRNGIIALNRDLLGLWNSGASLPSLMGVNGSGQGDARHLARWRSTYGRKKRRPGRPLRGGPDAV
ncbi:restriction endonuclease [Streptomyces cylindrosporus]|uniref:Restriction endonuclease n=1 Tax=Streptomyces cylindrosporus TaxID=2927583 RepID=A0ABS9Y3M5_9ACTN|nr:restriction endonuclease [Streptomyces cylindrosporus]MCI3271821.1 restriction endonuclease [Streptomyces cylindrosporus]